VFALALAVRLVWVSVVDSPFGNIFSDMGGYVHRALQAAYGEGDPYPIFGTLYPPGAHLVYAAEMRLAGWAHHGPFLVLNCAWGAVVAPCTMLLALRIDRRLWVATALGLLAALWYPLLAFAGFFSSEQPFAGAIALSAWLLVRQVESGKSTIALGVACAVAYLVRPQIILTLAALTLVGLFVLWRRPAGAPRLRVTRLIVAGMILTGAVAFGAIRYHALCGRWGLISDNSAMTRLWADTNYGKVRATWHSPDGRTPEFFFASPPKAEVGEDRELYFEGYVGDPVLLERARLDEVRRMSSWERWVRWGRNVRLLFRDNALWPESQHLPPRGWRRALYDGSHRLVLGSLPFVFWGILAGLRRPTTVLVVCSAHVLTALVVAAFFFAEQRYRVPYDMFLMLLAFHGARVMFTALREAVARSSPGGASANG
jgi:hypothetical protein